jgi:dienelactone hydrolase
VNEQSDRDAIIREIAKKKVVVKIPGMESLPVRRNLAYRDDLLMDIYYPGPDVGGGGQPPVVVIALGYPDPQSAIRTFGPVTSWAQLIAASGMAAVVYGSTRPAEDVHAALDYVRRNALSLDLNVQRVALFSASGNVPVALSALMTDRGITCAALVCGYTMDIDGSTVVADMAAQAGFVNACAGRTANDLPENVPMLFVRAGRDQFPGLNAALDQVVARAVARNLPLTLINHPGGVHGFDCYEDSSTSRGVVRQILAFLALHLVPDG